MDKHRLGSLFGLTLALLWGVSFLSIKVAVVEVPPMTMAAARFIVACAVLPLIARVKGERLTVPWKDLPGLALGGFTGVTLYFLGENHGVKLLSASEASLIISTIPVLTLVTDRILLGARAGFKVYAGALLSMAGVALIASRGAGTTASRLGYLYMGTACAAWVMYGLFTRKASARNGRITVTFWQILFGLLGCLPFALAESASWRTPSLGVTLNILYLGVFCSALGYWLYVSALEILGPSTISVFINLIPVVAVVSAYLILGERLQGIQWLGGVVAVAGVYLATTTRKQSSEHSLNFAHSEEKELAGD